MATNLIPPIDQSQAQLYCPMCDANGTPNVPLIRDMHICKCPFSHQYSSVAEAVARGARMIPMPLNEQPPVTSVKMTVWLHPRVKQILETKYRGRLIATTDVLLSSLADGSVLIMSGPDVDKLKKRGLNNGAQIVAALEAIDNTEAENRQLRAQIEKYESVFRAAGVGQQ